MSAKPINYFNLRLGKEERELIRWIEKHMFYLREKRVVLGAHLAELFGVEPRVLGQIVRRNTDLFPAPFAFRLNPHEFSVLRSQSVISKFNKINVFRPYAFSEPGMVMLASILSRPSRRRDKTQGEKRHRVIKITIAMIDIFAHPRRPDMRARRVLPRPQPPLPRLC